LYIWDNFNRAFVVLSLFQLDNISGSHNLVNKIHCIFL